jgi:hypothetical protein
MIPARGKAKNITHSEYVSVALALQHEMCMGRVLLPSDTSPALQRFSTLPQKRHDL